MRISLVSLAQSRISIAWNQKRRKILLLVAVATLAATAHVLLRPSVYVANTEILVDNNARLVYDLGGAGAGMQSDVLPSNLGSDLKLLTSSSTIDEIVDQIDPKIDQDRSFSLFEIGHLFGVENQTSNGAEKTASDRRSDIIRSHMVVEADPSTLVITISYRSRDPDVAAAVANDIANAFLARRAEVRQQAIQKTLKEVQRLAEDSVTYIRATQRRKDGGLPDALFIGQDTAAKELRFERLSGEFRNATVALAEAQSRLREANEVRDIEQFRGSALEAELSPLGREFLDRDRELRRRVTSFEKGAAVDNGNLIRAKTELALVQDALEDEAERIREEFRLQVQTADARVNELRAQFEDIEAKAPTVEKGDISSYRLYETVLERANQIVGLARMSVDNTRVIEPAIAPTSPNIFDGLLLIGFVLVVSTSFGILWTVMGELRRSGFNQSHEVEAHFEQPVLGMLPSVQGVVPLAMTLRLSSREKHWALQGYTFIEGVRGLLNTLLPRMDDETLSAERVVAITSCFPEEGKTILALSLARQSASGGAKVLLIEGDMRKVGLAAKLSTVSAKSGLVDLLSGRVDNVDDVIVKEIESGVDLLLASGPSEDAFALSRSSRFKTTINSLKKRYDLIIVDCPPVLGVSDTLALCDAVDEIVFVIRWQETARTTVRKAVKELGSRPIAGFVISQVDLQSQIRDAAANKYAYEDEFVPPNSHDNAKPAAKSA